MAKISIITATFNADETLRHNLECIQNQAVPVEHILIDGGSTDGTLDIANKYHATLAKIVSEQDQGIYDAMNKGIELATGEIIGILNADDFYASKDILARVKAVFEDPNVNACYGDLLYVASEDTGKVVRYWKSGEFNPKKFYWGWMPPHPTFFVRRSVYEKHGGFNLEMGSAADYELMLRFLLKHRIKTAYIPEILVKMRTGGISNASLKNRLEANKMDRKAWKVNGLKPYPWTLWMKPMRKIGQWFLRNPSSKTK